MHVSLVRFALAFLLAAGAAQAQEPEKGPRLFDSNDLLTIDLEADWTAVQRDRDGTPEPRPAKLTYTDASGPVSVPLTVETRGRSRLSKDVCEFAPLRLDFAKDELKGTLLRGIGELKLATHCGRAAVNEQYLLLEYLVYRSYNALTDDSYRVRLLKIRYRDPGKEKPRFEKYGFFIEDAADAAQRLGLERVSESNIDPALLDAEATARVEVFYYMIGMTDFSMRAKPDGPCCHNVRMLKQPSGKLTPLPYDFDQTGVVDPPYALPNEALGIKTVTQRKYRGLCRPYAETNGAIALLNERRAAITALFEAEPGLQAARKKKALGFLDDYYRWASDPAAVKKTIDKDCRASSA